MQFPNLYRIRQQFNTEKITNVQDEVHAQLTSSGIGARIQPGMTIAITAGSRGIANFATLVRSTCDFIREKRAIPIIIPSMGSHGGATAEGQVEVLKKFGITEASMGCEIRATMDVTLLGHAKNGAPVYLDRYAHEADGIISLNRVKPHTDFVADIESGLIKMLTVGLGNEKSAVSMHGYDLATTIPLSFDVMLEKAPLLGGLAVVENAKDETYLIRGILPENFLTEEKQLLEIAKRQVPQLPTDDIDILVVKEMGKAYSGTGMDTKVIGRIQIGGTAEPVRPRVKKLVVLRLSKASYGNALGIGLADITTKALVNSIDEQSLLSNLIPTTYLERGKTPISFATEEKAIEVAFTVLGNTPPEDARVVVIDNTLHLDEILVSKSVLDTLDNVTVCEENVPFSFDVTGQLSV